MSQSAQYSSLIDSGDNLKSLLGKCGNFFPDLVFLYDPGTGEISHVNDKLERWLGFVPDQLETRSLHELVHGEDSLLVRNALTHLAESERHTEDFTARFRCRHGGSRHLKVTATLVPGNVVQSASVLCVAHDVTDHIRSEEQAFSTHQLFDETEKLLLFGTWSWSAVTDKLEWTEGMYKLLDYEKDEVPLITHDFYLRHVLPEHLETVQRTVLEAIANRRDFEIEYVLRTRTGKEKFVFTKGKAVLDADGNLKTVVGITRDITKKNAMEKERDKIIRDLNRSNKELEEFAYVASHDLHEPLRKILTFSERLKARFGDSFGDEGRMYLERVTASADGMRSLINNLLEFSKISRGSRSFVRTDLGRIMNEVLSDQELRIEETGTRLTLKDLPVIEAVPAEIRQLFNNLISNALKFRKKDVHPEIAITCKKLSHKEKSEHLLPFSQTFYQISVQDNGIGFEPVYAEKIFEIFQRLHGKSEYSGSGIGLAICKKIVENHDGIIFASGEPDKGAVFSVILPEKQFH